MLESNVSLDLIKVASKAKYMSEEQLIEILQCVYQEGIFIGINLPVCNSQYLKGNNNGKTK